MAKRCLNDVAFGARWASSIEDDLLAEHDRAVNPVPGISKLLAFIVGGGYACVLLIELFR